MLGSNSSADSGPGLQEQVILPAPEPAVLAQSVKSRRYGGSASIWRLALYRKKVERAGSHPKRRFFSGHFRAFRVV
jgi:hypothetical protein